MMYAMESFDTIKYSKTIDTYTLTVVEHYVNFIDSNERSSWHKSRIKQNGFVIWEDDHNFTKDFERMKTKEDVKLWITPTK